MALIYAVLAIIAYIFMGLFSAGFVDIDPSCSSDVAIFWGIVILWPLCYIATILLIICAAPIRFGKKIGNRYRSAVERILEKSINVEVQEKEKEL